MSKTNNERVSTRELAERAGESYDTVDHWAGLGLLQFKRRGRARQFAIKESLKRCKRIRELQDEGHNLTTIKGMLSGEK